MNQESQGVTEEAAKRETHDGAAAVAIALLTVALIIFAAVKII